MQKKSKFSKLIFTPVILMTVILYSGCGRQTIKSFDDHKKGSEHTDSASSKKEMLGRLLFFEKDLSTPDGQGCVNCHDPSAAFADPRMELPVSKGAKPGHFGQRNDMTITYVAFVPPLHYDKDEKVWRGGLFWDGRANTLEEQAMGPPLNPLEMANPDTVTVMKKLQSLGYASMFHEVYGDKALSTPEKAFLQMADAIAAFERTSELSPFSSKFDYWLQGKAELTDQEFRGLKLFEAEDKGNCAACHPSSIGDDGQHPLFTDFTYDNLGIPKNPANPFYALPEELNPEGYDFIDLGLGKTLNDPDQNGKFRVPTLRNVAATPPYLHNGLFHSLFDLVSFYNTRDIADWPDAEVPENVNTDEMGDLGLTTEEAEDIVAFLNTLTDGWKE